eukprot:TRINITY_DN6040_c0_g3_i2.p1 TRINITY_DN6040_c0_g3~~TRINITY_DN6040_c0_g3_i2.p1  ORF type:complete len:186 (-),score=31.82 TRINITY_DN6040_c0_g3_i2:57-614(-)
MNSPEEPDINKLEKIAEQNAKKFAQRLNKKERAENFVFEAMKDITQTNNRMNLYEQKEDCMLSREEVQRYIDSRIELAMKENMVAVQKIVAETINKKIDAIEHIIKEEMQSLTTIKSSRDQLLSQPETPPVALPNEECKTSEDTDNRLLDINSNPEITEIENRIKERLKRMKLNTSSTTPMSANT